MLNLSLRPKFSEEKEAKARMERKPSFAASFQERRSSRIALLQSLERSGGSVVPSPPLEAKNARSEAQIQPKKMHGYGNDEVESEDLSSTYADCEASVEDSGCERLKRLRVEISGRVWIPDMWGQEELLKDWIDSTAFDASLFPSEIGSARAALVEEGRKVNSGRLRIENRC